MHVSSTQSTKEAGYWDFKELIGVFYITSSSSIKKLRTNTSQKQPSIGVLI